MVESPTRTARDRLDRMLGFLLRARRFWLAALALFLVGAAGAFAYAMVRPRVYKSETLILYHEGIRSADLTGTDSGGDPARKLGLKLKEMVLSRTRLQSIIEEFKLYPRLVDDRGFVDAVDEMRNHIAFRVKDSDTFGLSFEGEDPRRVQLVTARLAQTLIDENSKNRSEQAEVTREFLDTEKERAEVELKEHETNLARFLGKHPEFARETTQSSGTAFRAAGKSQPSPSKSSDPELLALEREAGRIQERLGVPSVKKKRDDGPVDPKLSAEKLAAEADLAAMQRELNDKLNQFTEQHPDVRAAKSRLKNAQDRLRRAEAALAPAAPAAEVETEGTIDRVALENELRRINDEIASRKRRKREEPSAAPSTSSAAWIVALETDWTRLNREVAESREKQQQLQDKQFKASMLESAVAAGRNTQMTIVDQAYKPTHPAKPGRFTIVAVGCVVALMLALGLALMLAFFDDRIYDRTDLEALGASGLRLLGVVPRRGSGRG